MLNGTAPILIFNFKQSVDITTPLSKIPVLNTLVPKILLPSIPLYLDENITGIYIDSQSKNIDVDTEIENTLDPNPVIKQKGINNIVTINMVANQGSIGMILLALFCDQMFSKLVKEEYSIDYLNNSVFLFGGLFHGFSSIQNTTNDLVNISLQLSKGRVNSTVQGLVSKIIQPFNGTVPGAT